MIIESHAHYSHPRYAGEFTYVNETFDLCQGTVADLVENMRNAGIGLCIEAGIDLNSVERQLALSHAFSDFFRQALGVHPKRCDQFAWAERERLDDLAAEHNFIAIGETGLDYAMPPELLNKPLQQDWFLYQIHLAHRLQLPLMLHVREAHRDALALLRQHSHLLHGGVAHCFQGDLSAAEGYLELGFALGIGGRLLHNDEGAQQLRQVVASLPPESFLLETDAPFILPPLDHQLYSAKQRKRARNSSLILPAVLEAMARLQGLPVAEVEQIVLQNTLRAFRMDPI